jgi:hypothetical protein
MSDKSIGGTDRETISCDSCGIRVWDTETGREEMEVHEAECDWTDDPRERFERGDRVQFSDFGRQRLDNDHREGEIVGFSEDPSLVRVTWDGRKTSERLVHSFIKHVEERI